MEKKEPTKKIFICITGSGKEDVAKAMRDCGANVHTINSFHEIKSITSNKITHLDRNSAGRIHAILLKEDSVNNKNIRPYKFVVLADTRHNVNGNDKLREIFNLADYFIYTTSERAIKFSTESMIKIMLNRII